MNTIKGIIQGFVILLVLHFSHGKEEKDRAGKICKYNLFHEICIKMNDIFNK